MEEIEKSTVADSESSPSRMEKMRDVEQSSR